MVIIFGAINFFKNLPYVEADKVFGSPFELAWCDKVGGYDKNLTQKPVFLMGAIIRDFTRENDIILDQFLGSGTTAVACQNLHRNFIEIDISEESCKIAEQRLKQKPLP